MLRRAEIENRIRAFGALYERMSKGDNTSVGDGLRVILPSEHTLELYSDIEYVGTATGLWNPDPWPRRGLRGIGVPRLDHMLITTEDPALLERFFAEVLDFQPAERLVGGPDNTDLVGSWMFLRRAGTRHRTGARAERQAAPLRLSRRQLVVAAARR